MNHQPHPFFRKASTILLAMIGAIVAISPASQAWHDDGHYTVTFEAVVRLPPDVPMFFRANAPTVAHMSIDPDVARHPDAEHLRSTIAPEHYIDLELLAGKSLPADRYEYIALCNELDVSPKKAGMLPYAIIENTERLMLAFAEHRKWPNDPAIQAKCLAYAGILSHYTADLCMPLHTTIHFNGKTTDDGKSPRTGIHDKVDALLGKWPVDKWNALRTPAPAGITNNWTYILRELARSHDRVDLVYNLEGSLPAVDEPIGDNPDINIFVFEAAYRATSVTNQLIYSAWAQSASIELLPEHDRSIERASAEVEAAEAPTLPDVEDPAVRVTPLTNESTEAAANRPDFDSNYDEPMTPPAASESPEPVWPEDAMPASEARPEPVEEYEVERESAPDTGMMPGITVIEVDSEVVEDEPTK